MITLSHPLAGAADSLVSRYPGPFRGDRESHRRLRGAVVVFDRTIDGRITGVPRQRTVRPGPPSDGCSRVACVPVVLPYQRAVARATRARSVLPRLSRRFMCSRCSASIPSSNSRPSPRSTPTL